MSVLYFFTEYYPFGDESMSEHAFLNNEINYLIDTFDHVVVVPTILPEPLPGETSFEVDTTLANLLKDKTKLEVFSSALKSGFFYKELISSLKKLNNTFNLKKVLNYTGRSRLVRDWLKSKLVSKNLKLEETLFYTFWNNEITLGISSVENTKVVSRAHGHDLYENYYGYLPCYKYNLKRLEKLFLVSQAAVNYLEEIYPDFTDKYKKQYLGVKKAKKRSEPSNDHLIRIVSCSYLIKRKRVDLIADGIAEFVKRYKRTLRWTHFGDGPEKEKIMEKVDAIPDGYIETRFMGNVENRIILNHYEEEPVDLFILTSEEEGGVPVVLQEAQAHGIPVIGTDAGGISEIVHDKVGVLLNKNPTPSETAKAINSVFTDQEYYLKMRKNSMQNWDVFFNEKKNYEQFSQILLKIARGENDHRQQNN